MDLLSGSPLWLRSPGAHPPYPPLRRAVRCDVAVIGAGITGALVAWHLARAGVATVVLDRRAVASGSTAGSTALLQYELDVPLHRLVQMIGSTAAVAAYADARAAVKELGAVAAALPGECGFRRTSSLQVAHRAADVPALRREFAARHAAGIPVRWWSRRELARRSALPHAAALYSPRGEAAEVDARAFALQLLAEARRHGARIFAHTRVVRRRATRRGVVLRTEHGERVDASWVVIAAGYEAEPRLPARRAELHSTFAFASAPLPALTGWPRGRPVIWETGDPYWYARTTSDRRVILGGADEPFANSKARTASLAAKVRELERAARRWFPKLELRPACAWAGTFGKTPDGLPLIGERPRQPRTWFALGYSGNGIVFSQVAAQLLLARLRDGTPAPTRYAVDRRVG